MAVFSGSDLSCERGERVVFEGVSFRVASGTVTELRGANGSGKSTLLRMMAGLIPPTRGQIAWNDADVDRDRDGHRTRINYIGHHDGVKGMLSVAENLRFWIDLARGDDDKSVDARVALALSVFGIPKLAETPARYLSAGQRRRVALARLIVRPSQIWLLDEPATALDAAALACLDHAMAAHLGSGGIVVMATHEAPKQTAPRIDLDEIAHNRRTAAEASAA